VEQSGANINAIGGVRKTKQFNSIFPIHKIVQPKLYLRVVGDNSVGFIFALVRLNGEISVKALEVAHGRKIGGCLLYQIVLC
jgi:hypothetical protein